MHTSIRAEKELICGMQISGRTIYSAARSTNGKSGELVQWFGAPRIRRITERNFSFYFYTTPIESFPFFSRSSLKRRRCHCNWLWIQRNSSDKWMKFGNSAHYSSDPEESDLRRKCEWMKRKWMNGNANEWKKSNFNFIVCAWFKLPKVTCPLRSTPIKQPRSFAWIWNEQTEN